MVDMAALAAAIQATPDGPARIRLADLYHAANVDRFGPFSAAWYRKEYEWLRANPSMGKLILFPPRLSPKPT
jgi:hypothetical protein